MDSKQMLDLVERYQQNKEFITNEETVKMALVVPFIHLLGYDPKNPREVRLEYAADFTQGDGKRYADRMDFAIFDPSGQRPLLVIETKPLGTDLRAKSQQLARYIAQLPDLHFGIITDGCHYLLFGDLEAPNNMDTEPFFSFSLDDPKTDWAKVANFLHKFSRDAFNADTLITDAENSRYRTAMIDKLTTALRTPGADESFMKWLTANVYKGHRTAKVMERLEDVARDAIEPALLRLLSDDFLAKLRARMDQISQDTTQAPQPDLQRAEAGLNEADDSHLTARASETTADELEAFELVRAICVSQGHPAEAVMYKDTVNYFNVSYERPTKWFLRYFSRGKRRALVTHVPLAEARTLCPGFDVEEAPSVFGASRVFFDVPSQLWELKDLIGRSLQIGRGSE